MDCSSELQIERNREYRKRKSAPATGANGCKGIGKSTNAIIGEKERKINMKKSELYLLAARMVLRSDVTDIMDLEGCDFSSAESYKLDMIRLMQDGKGLAEFEEKQEADK